MVSASQAAYCNVDGASYNSSSGSPLLTSSAPLNGDVCNHTVYADSTGTCYLRIVNSDDVSSGDCLTVGKGVQITTDGTHALTCSGTSCGIAIKYAALGTTSANTTVDGAIITGCFSKGVSSAHQVTNSTIDLSGSCTGGERVAISANLVDGCKVSGATLAFAGTPTVRNSIISNCTYGVWAGVSGSPATLENLLLYGNTYSLLGASGLKGNLKSSVVLDDPATTCHCYFSLSNPPACQSDISDCVNFTGDPSMVDDLIRD